jgi:hypothetical protein
MHTALRLGVIAAERLRVITRASRLWVVRHPQRRSVVRGRRRVGDRRRVRRAALLSPPRSGGRAGRSPRRTPAHTGPGLPSRFECQRATPAAAHGLRRLIAGGEPRGGQVEPAAAACTSAPHCPILPCTAADSSSCRAGSSWRVARQIAGRAHHLRRPTS